MLDGSGTEVTIATPVMLLPKSASLTVSDWPVARFSRKIESRSVKSA
jgi:hypothetical protein